MERRYQVFISSTYTDLVEERREVIQALLEMDILPAGMEMFPAADQDQWTLIQGVIDQSDYYLVVVGGRYGSTTAEGISYTEKEYDYAVSTGVPVMGFVHADPDAIPTGKSSIEPEARARLDAFREKVMGRMVKQFSSPAELGSVVSRGLMRLQKDNPREGWVRGGNALTPETLTEIAELRAQVAELKQQTSENARNIPVIEGLAQGDDAYLFRLDVVGSKIEDEGLANWQRGTYVWSVELPTTWNQVLENVGPALLNEATQREFERAVLDYGRRLWRAALKARWPKDLLEVTDTRLNASAVEDVAVQLFATGLTEHGVKKRALSEKNKYWALTSAGQDQMMRLRAIRKP